MVVLDATAGNRMMWPNKTPPGVIFIDKETRLQRPPTIFADNTKLPFRINFLFSCVFFDPPFGINMPPWWTNPVSKPGRKKGYKPAFYGDMKSKGELLSYLFKAQSEFKKYTNRLCLKWSERNIPLWNILPFFMKNGWIKIFEKQELPKQGKNTWRPTGKKTFWITFIRSSLRTTN